MMCVTHTHTHDGMGGGGWSAGEDDRSSLGGYGSD